MGLPNELEEKIEEDLKRAINRVSLILQGANDNHIVRDPDYMDPTIDLGRTVSYNDKLGEVVYYSNIAEALEIALRTGAIPHEYASQLPRAPEYVTKLIRTD